MIKVTILYPNEEGKKFDLDYFLNSHMPMVHRLLDPMGMKKGEVEKGVSAPDPSQPAPFVVVAHLIFDTAEQVHTAFAAHGREIMGDAKNYTEIASTVQISEVLV